MIRYVITNHSLSERQACALLQMSRTGYRYKAKTPDDGVLREALLTLAVRQPRWGVKKMSAYFKNQGKPHSPVQSRADCIAEWRAHSTL